MYACVRELRDFNQVVSSQRAHQRTLRSQRSRNRGTWRGFKGTAAWSKSAFAVLRGWI